MDSRRNRNFRNNFDKTMLDKQVDKIFETGRQFVDGVSGARPGKKRNTDFQELSRRKVKNVGRWVTDKIDLFFEEDNDDWYDEDYSNKESREIKSFTRESRSVEVVEPFSKRPLEALSLRQPKNFQTTQQKKLPAGEVNSIHEWPDDLDFKVDRWQRSFESENNTINSEKTRTGLANGRSMPRSRRRRI